MDEQPPAAPDDPGDAGSASAGPPMPAPPIPAAYPDRTTPAISSSGVPRPVPAARQRVGMLVTLGGLLVVIGVFLPWAMATGPGGSVSQNGMDLNNWGVLLLGGFALARGLSTLRPATFHFNLGTPLIGGVLLAVLTGSRWSDLHNAVQDARAIGLNASVGIGFYAVIAGTALVLLGGLLSLQRR